jgi:hypothetical protein
MVCVRWWSLTLYVILHNTYWCFFALTVSTYSVFVVFRNLNARQTPVDNSEAFLTIDCYDDSISKTALHALRKMMTIQFICLPKYGLSTNFQMNCNLNPREYNANRNCNLGHASTCIQTIPPNQRWLKIKRVPNG